MDALGQLAQLVERVRHDGANVVEEHDGFVCASRLDETAGELKVDRDGDELLLDAVVQSDARSNDARRRRRQESCAARP